MNFYILFYQKISSTGYYLNPIDFELLSSIHCSYVKIYNNAALISSYDEIFDELKELFDELKEIKSYKDDQFSYVLLKVPDITNYTGSSTLNHWNWLSENIGGCYG